MKTTKVIIPKPCNKGWNNMTPNINGRHCDSCDKTVVDFTQMNKEEIKNYFLQRSGAKICGHFKLSQVERNQPKLHAKLISLYNYVDQKITLRIFKNISLASLTMCMFLVGCQNKTGEKKVGTKNYDDTTQTLTGDTTLPYDPNNAPTHEDIIKTNAYEDSINNAGKHDMKCPPFNIIEDKNTVDGDFTIMENYLNVDDDATKTKKQTHHIILRPLIVA